MGPSETFQAKGEGIFKDVSGECDNIRYATIKNKITGSLHDLSSFLCANTYHVAMKEKQ